ncbi:hypothetical protein RBA41_31385 [Massilia sp. CCM 9210]|uniref:hypothetical protein n=1 Tax=Massilia scottii TaxID=3057166 RepID=UPI00279677A1|nr:hypothetical protein [Massilia sp. CCM 9210]MDQ1817814.1 hypothetical protein [Massilia sp. CCM 9210]
MSTDRLIYISRLIALTLGSITALSTLGGFVLGFLLLLPQFLDVATRSIEVSSACWLWWYYAKEKHHTDGFIKLLVLIAFILITSSALKINLIYLLWVSGYAFSTEEEINRTMRDHLYIGPFLILYALLLWVAIKRQKK